MSACNVIHTLKWTVEKMYAAQMKMEYNLFKYEVASASDSRILPYIPG